eukprot:GHVU01100331.1.p1 GENE.GHVU01100331.1~~GHVU01100331.1.p1  ORF type:complete len:184 (+),score=5.36 GHVU01100331.1:458-1009(+)
MPQTATTVLYVHCLKSSICVCARQAREERRKDGPMGYRREWSRGYTGVGRDKQCSGTQRADPKGRRPSFVTRLRLTDTCMQRRCMHHYCEGVTHHHESCSRALLNFSLGGSDSCVGLDYTAAGVVAQLESSGSSSQQWSVRERRPTPTSTNTKLIAPSWWLKGQQGISDRQQAAGHGAVPLGI